jgi:hypothetical protein
MERHRHQALSVRTAVTVHCVQTITMNCVQHITDINDENGLMRGRKIYSARLQPRRVLFYITAVDKWPELFIQQDTAPSPAVSWSSLLLRPLNIHNTWPSLHTNSADFAQSETHYPAHTAHYSTQLVPDQINRHPLIPWTTAFPDKLARPQAVKKFSTLCGTRRFITMFTTVRNLSQPSAKYIKSTRDFRLPTRSSW